MPGWADLRTTVKDEIIQRTEEGCDTSGFDAKLEAAKSDEELRNIYDELQSLDVKSDCPYVEPTALDEIRASRVNPVKKWDLPDESVLVDRIKGAWLGRIAGCMLGKPVEGWPRVEIEKYLQAIGEFPLTNYIPHIENGLAQDAKKPTKESSRGQWNRALIDDDTNYTVLNMQLFEQKSPSFTTKDMGDMWLQYLPYLAVFTAERQAYLNLINELPIERVPTFMNPYREWIGAQIRADFFGYAAPGDPDKAAEFAHRDATLSHVKNGVYGEMFCAAAIAAAFATDDVYEIIDAGLSVVPPKSRIAETVADALRWRKELSTWEEACDAMMQTYYGKYNWVHTNNNLAIVLISLLYGWPDVEKVLCASVQMGLDTDCNGATAGSIIGAALGAGKLPDKWIKPLGGELETSIAGSAVVSIEKLAERTLAQVKAVRELK